METERDKKRDREKERHRWGERESGRDREGRLTAVHMEREGPQRKAS